MSIRFLLILLGVTAGMPLAASAQEGPGSGLRPVRPDFNPDQAERQDFGVQPTTQLHAGPMHGPTPSSIPGGQVITTQGLAALLHGRQAPHILFDVLGQPQTLPGAVTAAWLAQPGSYNDAVQQQAVQLFGQLTQGRRDVALVFYCLSRECWMSYNAALRAVQAGYTNVLWYRAGIEAWRNAGLATQQAAQGHAQVAPGFSQQQARSGTPGKFVPVEPLVRPPASAPPAGPLLVRQGQVFTFAIPPGWQIGEEGQFAVTLIAPDYSAFTMMIGNAGLPLNTAPASFAHRKLSALQPQQLRIGQPRPARPAVGFPQAVEFDVSFVARGYALLGLAKVSVAPAYDSSTMAMTLAVSVADQWPGYRVWLPQVADLVSANNGAAFGMRGIMRQNIQNSVALGNAEREFRQWSQKNWGEVTDARGRSADSRNAQFRENLGASGIYADPFGTSPPKELPTTRSHIWMDRQGRMIGTDDPTADPNVGSTGEWRKMERVVQ